MAQRLIMDNLVRHLKFPITFDPTRLQQDLDYVMDKKWVAHYNTQNYQGAWTSLALMSADGVSSSIHALPIDDKEIVYTEIMNNCHYFKEILETFAFEKTAVRLLKLAVGAEVKPHSDHCLGYEDGTFRIHIPICTNPEVEFILDNQRLVMKEGECWYINANFIHSVANRGTQDRVHLVIDGIRNEWSDQLFFKNATEEQFAKPKIQINESEKALMIAELQRMNTPIALKMIEDLTSE